ncbi:hypothetical protein HPT27_16180 [Permianibacter sp. IMCC34836]|uniref:hypothetical protein n=1 Tax=Permianibacter fluminis TaxID=2738515 RepID=UPI001555C0DB|nr:hypothetical protein [Permianibacter fluminis]NQD38562.1 hypothetical protein [Permianibacter fluminis]
MAAAKLTPLLPPLQRLRWRHSSKVAAAVLVTGLLPVLVLLVQQGKAAAWLLPLPLLAAVIAGYAGWRDSGRLLARWLDDAIADLQDSSFLLFAPTAQEQPALSPLAALQQQRLLTQLSRHQAELTTILPRPLPRLTYGLSAVIAVLFWFWFAEPVTPLASSASTAESDAAASSTPAVPRIQLQITPPAYTGLPPFTAGAGDVQIPEGSRVQFCLLAAEQSAFDDIDVQWLDGEARSLRADVGGTLHGDSGSNPNDDSARCVEWQFDFSTGYRLRRHEQALADARGRLLLLADTAPVILVRQPSRETQDVDSQQYLLDLDITIDDDYGLSNASLHWTLARGGGENVRFTDREQHIKPAADGRHWQHQQALRLRTLGMEPGDELYFYVTAKDGRQPQAQLSRSRTYILRHPVESNVIEGGARIPSDLGKAKFRSQRQIILDTEALISQRKTLPVADFRQRSEKLAQDQMVLRLRYGEFLGEESSFEAAGPAPGGHDEHEDSGNAMAANGIGARLQSDVVATYGHAHDEAENATLFDEATKAILRRALQAMWSAEGGLRMSTPEPALPHEYAALNAIKELQQAERIYLHKTAFSPPPLEANMRFSGDASGARSVQRQHQQVTAAEQQLLLQALAALTAPVSESAPAPTTGLTPALEQQLQQHLQQLLRSQDEEGKSFALASLALLQDLRPGCDSCRAALRDQLALRLNSPLPALQAAIDRHGAFRAALKQATDSAAVPNTPALDAKTPSQKGGR